MNMVILIVNGQDLANFRDQPIPQNPVRGRYCLQLQIHFTSAYPLRLLFLKESWSFLMQAEVLSRRVLSVDDTAISVQNNGRLHLD